MTVNFKECVKSVLTNEIGEIEIRADYEIGEANLNEARATKDSSSED
jgi:hypothetical protein